MEIEIIDLSSERAFGEWFRPVQEAELHSWPDEPGWTERELAGRIRTSPSFAYALGVAREVGSVVGSMSLRMPLLDNLDVAEIEIAVRPSARRRGAGGLLLTSAEAIARDEGRGEIHAGTLDPMDRIESSPGRQFLQKAGYAPGLDEARRELRLPLAEARIDGLEAALMPRAAGYSFVSWNARCPDDLVEARADLGRAISADAPSGELEVEAENWDAERVRAAERSLEEIDRESYCAGVVHDATGRLVGYTQLTVPRQERGTAYQWDTVVLRAHRGHHLGMLLKLANLRALQEISPETKRILTENAVDNGPMIRVNEELGFEVIGLGTIWKKTLAANS